MKYDVSIIDKNNALYFSGNGKQAKMNAETNKRFYVTGGNGEFEFKTDEKGKVTGLQLDAAHGHTFLRKLIERLHRKLPPTKDLAKCWFDNKTFVFSLNKKPPPDNPEWALLIV